MSMNNQRCSIMKLVRALNTEEQNGGFWLPNIQRPFVWKEDQIERLFDSIMREYPISTLLVWWTKEPIKHRKFIDNWHPGLRLSDYYVPSNERVKNLVLDGQQRLQSLFIGLHGSYDGRELFLNVLSGDAVAPEDIRYQFRFLDPKKAEWPWVRFKDIIHDLRSRNMLSTELATKLESHAKSPLLPEQKHRLLRNLTLVDREFVHDDNISYQELDGVESNNYALDDVLEIFIRANTGGTKLGKSDLMFSLLAQNWTESDEEMEELLEQLNKSGYAFTRDFVLKSCLVMLDRGAKYEVAKFRDDKTRDAFVSKWTRLSDAIKAVRDFVYSRTFLRSDKALPSYMGLIPLVYFRYHFPERWKTAKGLEDYLLRVLLSGAFSGTPDNLIDRCVNAIRERGDFDVEEIFGIIRADNRSLEVTADTILSVTYGQRESHLIFNLLYRDFDYAPSLEDNLPQQDHIFPQSALRKLKVANPRTGRHDVLKHGWRERDQIANLMLLTAEENGFGGKCDALPSEWFPKRLARDPNYLKRHLIPEDPALWELDNYDKFIEARKQLILEKLKPYIQVPIARSTQADAITVA